MISKLKLFYTSLLPFCLVCLALSSCDSNQSSNGNARELVANPSKDKIINLDSLTSISNKFQRFTEENGKTVLNIVNFKNATIDQYDWETGQFKNRLTFEKVGPNGVGEIYDFYQHTADSIFLLNSERTIHLVDAKAKVKRSYSLVDKERDFVFYTPYNPTSFMQVIDGKLYATSSPSAGPEVLEYYTKYGYSGLELDLKTGKLESVMKLPEHWITKFNEGFKLTNQQVFFGYAFNAAKGTAIVNYWVDNELYEVDLKTKKVTPHEAKSETIGNISWLSRSVDTRVDPRAETLHLIKNGFYPSVYYDEYRDVYYRFVAHESARKQRDIPLLDFSLIVLDKDFNKITEKFFEEGECLYYELFITKDAVYLSASSEEEEELKFKAFELK